MNLRGDHRISGEKRQEEEGNGRIPLGSDCSETAGGQELDHRGDSQSEPEITGSPQLVLLRSSTLDVTGFLVHPRMLNDGRRNLVLRPFSRHQYAPGGSHPLWAH